MAEKRSKSGEKEGCKLKIINVSCRHEFTSAARFHKEHLDELGGIGMALAGNLPVGLRRLELPRHYGIFDPNYVLGTARETVRNALVCVHGFNSDVGRAERRYLQLAQQALTVPVFSDTRPMPVYEIVVGFYWPGAWSSGFGWVQANWNVQESAKRFDRLVRLMNNLGYRITISAHSLGCRVVHAAMQFSRTVERVVLAAPAVPNNMRLAHGWQQSTGAPTALHIAYSRDDKTLGRLYRIFNPFRSAMGYSGPTKEALESQDSVYDYDYTGIVTEHGGYVENSSFVSTFVR